LRGDIKVEAASLSGVTHGDRIGMVLGLSVERKAGLELSYQYYDDAGNLLAEG